MLCKLGKLFEVDITSKIGLGGVPLIPVLAVIALEFLELRVIHSPAEGLLDCLGVENEGICRELNSRNLNSRNLVPQDCRAYSR